MKWEYANLINTSKLLGGKWTGSALFSGPSGSKTFEGFYYIVYLNELGQEGWEAYAVEIRDIGNVGNMAIEHTFWLKRPAGN